MDSGLLGKGRCVNVLAYGDGDFAGIHFIGEVLSFLVEGRAPLSAINLVGDFSIRIVHSSKNFYAFNDLTDLDI